MKRGGTSVRWSGLLLASVGSAAFAQTAPAGDSAEIIVTAQRRSESLQDVPISITAFTGKQLQELKVDRPSDITALAPGAFVSGSRGDQNPVFAIRGLSLNDTFSNNNPTVGVYVDEIIQPFTPMLAGQLFDLERVEVLKGPQGTLYGRNTTGGAINFITRKPTQEMSGYGTLSYSRFDRAEIEGAVGGGVTDTLAARFAGKTTQQRGGWQTNALTGQKIGDVDRTSIRGQLLWTPSTDLRVLLKGGYTYDKSDQQQREHVPYYAAPFGAAGFCAAALAGRLDPTSCVDFLGYSDKTPKRRTVEASSVFGVQYIARAWDASLNIDYDLGGVKLTSISGYNKYRRVAGEDSDGGALIELDSRFTDDIRSFTQEVRLTSDTDGPFEWVGGLYYSYDRIQGGALQALDQHIFRTRVNTEFDQETDAYAAFGQATYKLTPALRLTGGLRFTHEKKDFLYNSVDLNPFGTSANLPRPVAGIDNSLSQDNLSGKIGIDFDLSRDVLLYASASRGFKSGGFKAAIAFNPVELDPFRGETVWAYEAGVKSTLMDGRLTLNAAGFYLDWRNFQAMVTEVRSGINVIVLSNAGDARVYGAEAEATFRPTGRLLLRASGNYQDTKITEFNSVPGSDDFTGNRLANAPKWSFAGLGRWETPLEGDGWGVYVLGDASYRSRVFYSLANRGQNSQEGYWLLNGRIALHEKNDRWELAAFGRNILNKLYVSASYDNWGGIFPSQNFLGDPATYGIAATVRF